MSEKRIHIFNIIVTDIRYSRITNHKTLGIA